MLKKLKKLKKKLHNEKGAMDKIIVTLLFVIVAVVSIVGVSTWTENRKTEIEAQALAKIEAVLEEHVPASE